LKKIILLTLLITSLYSKATVYVGADYGYYSENFDSIDAKSSSNLTRLKVGYGDIKSYAVEFSLEYVMNKSNIFSVEGQDGNKLGFDIALIKAYDFNKYFYPYVKVGFGSGVLDISRSVQSRLSYGSFNAGAGFYIPITQHVDIELAYLYKQVSYEPINFISYRKSYQSKINTTSLGINIRF